MTPSPGRAFIGVYHCRGRHASLVSCPFVPTGPLIKQISRTIAVLSRIQHTDELGCGFMAPVILSSSNLLRNNLLMLRYLPVTACELLSPYFAGFR